MEMFEIQSFLEGGYLQEFFANFRTIVPGKITSFDTANNTAQIEVTIKQQNASGEAISGTITLNNIPCLMAGGIQNYATYQLTEGDQGLLLVCDRDIDNFKSSQGQNGFTPTQGVANLKDSIFIAGLFLPGAADGLKVFSSTQIKLECGDSSITLTPEQIEAEIGNANFSLTPNSVTLSANGQNIQIADGTITLNGPVVINGGISFGEDGGSVTGNVTIDGTLSATENISSESDVLADTISLKTHVHGGVEEGTGTTGEPEVGP